MNTIQIVKQAKRFITISGATLSLLVPAPIMAAEDFTVHLPPHSEVGIVTFHIAENDHPRKALVIQVTATERLFDIFSNSVVNIPMENDDGAFVVMPAGGQVGLSIPFGQVLHKITIPPRGKFLVERSPGNNYIDVTGFVISR